MFNYFDVIVIALLLGFGYLGYETGILASLFYVLSGFVGIWAAQEFSSKIDLNFYILFFTAAGIVILAGLFIRKLLKTVFLGGFDRMVGTILGIFMGGCGLYIYCSFVPSESF